MHDTRQDYSDQVDIFNPDTFSWPIHVIGLGGIGSSVLFPLIKIGFAGTLHLWDTDVVEPHNLPAQAPYRPSDLGLKKAEAAKSFAERQEASCEIVVHDEFVTSTTPLDGVVISGVDSMKSRKAIWEAVSAVSYMIPLYMDGRIGGENYQLLTLGPSDYDQKIAYEQWLFDDSEGAPLPCGQRTNIHTPYVLAGHMVAQLTVFARGLSTKANIQGNVKSSQQIFANQPTPPEGSTS